MTPTNKGNYSYCNRCRHQIKNSSEKYPCRYSHREDRGSIKYERDFKECVLFCPTDEAIVCYTNLF